MQGASIVQSKAQRGMVLIIVAGVLAVLAALGASFYTVMHMQTRSAYRYADSVRAEMMTHAGIQYAVNQLRDQVFRRTETPTDAWYQVDYLHNSAHRISYPDSPLIHDGFDQDGDGLIDNPEEAYIDPTKLLGYSAALGASVGPNSDRFSLKIHDAASRININACDNLAVVLDNLCRVVGSPLVAADQDAILPRRWAQEGATAGMFDNAKNADDLPTNRNVYYWLYDSGGGVVWDGMTKTGEGRPKLDGNGQALYGDGYAIAGYHAKNGRFKSLEEVKEALTWVDRNANDKCDLPMERLEVEAKFAAIRDYITVDSWVDTSSICVGKFEWVPNSGGGSGGGASDLYDIAIDRDKSWVPDDPVNDPKNERGSLRGCYVAIINGHGQGQMRRIKTNGIDWIQVEKFNTAGVNYGFVVPPGPTSSYMIIANEDAKLVDLNGADLPNNYLNNPPAEGTLTFPKTDASGNLVDEPAIDYNVRPLCIHRAPVNLNTASDKVLAALFMGINVTHGNYMAVGTNADLGKLAQYETKVTATPKLKSRWKWSPMDPDWKINDYDDPNLNPYRTVEPYILTPKGLKRVPGDTGKIVFDVDFDALIKPTIPPDYNMDYISNYGTVDPAGTSMINEAQELAYRVIIARQQDTTYPYLIPTSGAPSNAGAPAYMRGPFRCWDDFYFRVVKPWDDSRINPTVGGVANPRYDGKRGSVARLIMSQFNPNSDLLKYNPNIEWIDRWGRNFTEMEPVMVYTNQAEVMQGASQGHGAIDSKLAVPGDIITSDQAGILQPFAVPVFTRERNSGWPNFSVGMFGTDPRFNGSYVTRSFRYKADELIDKSDLNRSTTEFSFDSRGVYEIESLGQVVKSNEILAERKSQALVKVYDVWSESTQRQFVNGYIKRATGDLGTPQAGRIARDATNSNSRLTLTTLPEPVVPLTYRMNNPKFEEYVDTTLGGSKQKRNAWGQVVADMTIPDVISNHVLPAGYDGQITLATNQLRYDPSEGGDRDTFLDEFIGDVDTATCKGNGRDQAKTPVNCQTRVTDTFSILGLLNDAVIDTDPGLSGNASTTTAVTPDLPPYAGTPLRIWRFNVAVNALRGLDPKSYWNNVSCRVGDLRADGCYVTGPGVGGNDGVLKFPCGPDDPSKYDDQNFSFNDKGATRSFSEGSGGSAGDVQGVTITMWAKTTWHHNDGRNHDFFDATLPGWADNGVRSQACYLRKQGRTQWAVSERVNSGGNPINITSSTNDMVPYEDPTWGVSGSGNRVNDLSLVYEPDQDAGDQSDPDWPIYMHGGLSGLPQNRIDPVAYPGTYRPESPSYRIQPFRWQFLGARMYLKPLLSACNNTFPAGSKGATPSDWNERKSGFWKPNQDPLGWIDKDATWVATNLWRPFIDSERWSEAPNFDPNYNANYKPWAKYWVTTQPQGSTSFNRFQPHGRQGAIGARGLGGQSARWAWASPGGDSANGGPITDFQVFGVNNCNPGYGYKGAGDFCSIYRNSPDEGTYAVLDGYKISRKESLMRNPPEPAGDRVTRANATKPGEMTLSRYYLPVNPADRTQCPTFTSQTILDSLKGKGLSVSLPEYVTLVRCSWNVFTPRFLHGYKDPANTPAAAAFKRPETITKQTGTLNFLASEADPKGNAISNLIPFRGPFDYCIYNDIKCWPNGGGEKPEDYADPMYDTDPKVFPYRCQRPPPAQYPGNLSHANKGVELEILEDTNDYIDDNSEVTRGGPYTNPNAVNAVGTMISPVRIRTDRLRYRVCFRYPVDPLADPLAPGAPWVDPTTQYLLDTPVFDDVSITYYSKLRIIDYRQVTE